MVEFVLPEYLVSTDRLRVGVFIRLEGLKWYEHPFLFKNFKIASDDQIQTLRAIGVKEVICLPGKSDVLPLSEPLQSAGKDGEENSSTVDDFWRIKTERAERLKKRQERIAQCERNYIDSQERVGKIMTGISSGNPTSVGDAAEFAEAFATSFLEDSQSTLHLMQLASKEENAYFHSLNVTVLSMMLGREIGIQAEEMKVLCQGALFHDIGKSRIDRKVLFKEKNWTKAELDFLQMHPKYGVEILADSEDFPKLALLIIYQHHEAADGSGYPKGLTGPQIHLLTKLVTIANIYDNHCNKRNPADSLTPFEALSHMFSKQKSALDEKLLSAFIRCLGIYPPGTVVQLNNGSIGMVISVNPENQLYPSIVIYDPEIPKKDALIIDMQDDPDLKIAQSIRPAALPREIFDYLSPRERVTYFVDTAEGAQGNKISR
ncbi:MAG: HD-GYP domain-containing protein [Syntrophales bacterium]|nr:HD-GYP domain-containing protein [Syntrophales bacterium]